MCSAVFVCRCPLCGEEASFSTDDGITENGELYVSFFCSNNEIHAEPCQVQIVTEACMLQFYATVSCNGGITVRNEKVIRCFFCGSALEFVFEYRNWKDLRTPLSYPFYECVQDRYVWCVKELSPTMIIMRNITRTFMEEKRLEVGDVSRVSENAISDRQLQQLLTWLLQHGLYL